CVSEKRSSVCDQELFSLFRGFPKHTLREPGIDLAHALVRTEQFSGGEKVATQKCALAEVVHKSKAYTVSKVTGNKKVFPLLVLKAISCWANAVENSSDEKK